MAAMFCRQCGYNLAALPENRCPECGQGFDPADPRTFARRPARPGIKWLVRGGIAMLLLAAAGGGGYAWLRHDWRVDLQARNAIVVTPRRNFTVSRAGPEWLSSALGSHGNLLDRTTAANLRCRTLTREEWQSLARLHHLQDLTLYYVGLTDNQSEFLGHLTELRILNLTGNREVADGTMARLQHLPRLHTLSIGGTAITDNSLELLSHIRSLEMLDLKRTRISGAGLKNLVALPKLKSLNLYCCNQFNETNVPEIRRLTSLEDLDLRNVRISDEAIESLASLPHLRKLMVYRDNGADFVQRLRQRRPGLVLVTQ